MLTTDPTRDAPPTGDALAALPLPPRVTVPYPRLVWEVKDLTRIYALVRAADGPIATFHLGPKRLVPPIVLVQNAAGAHDVLVGQADRLDKGDVPFFEEFRRLVGRSSFTMGDTDWAPRRRVLQPVMNRRHVDSFVHHMQAAAETAIAGWTDGREVELAGFGREVTLDVIGRSLFALDLAARRTAVTPAMARTMRRALIRGLAPTPLPNWMRTPRSRRDQRVLYAPVFDAIDAAEARRRQASAGDEGARGGELVDLLLDVIDPDTGERLGRQAVADELLTFFAAGHDTTATALSAALWLLARHPGVQERVRAEAAGLGDHLTIEDVGHLIFTRQVLEETMRLYSPANGIMRRCLADAKVAGYRIPAGWTVAVAVSGLHRDPVAFPDPDRFDPSRFAPAAVAERDRTAYLPFGAGRRACSGSHFALLEATVALAVIVRRFRLTSDQAELRVTTPLTLNLEPPVAVTAHRLSRAHSVS